MVARLGTGAFRALALAAGLWAGCAAAETLPEAVLRAVRQFPEVRAALANRRAIEQNAVQARSAWLPTMDASLGGGTQSADNFSTRLLGSDQTLHRREAQLSLSQLLFDGGAATGQIQRFDAQFQGADDQLANVAQDAALRTAQAYLEVMRLRGVIELAADNVRRHEETLAQVALLADSGRGRRADAQQAEARLALAQSSVSQLRGQLVQAEAVYRHLVGQAPSALVSPGEFGPMLPPSINDALRVAVEQHPAVRASQQDLVSAQADRESARGRFSSPRLALEAGTSANHNLDGVRGANGDRYAMLRLRYNLYRGGADESRVLEAEARVDEALAKLDKARNDVERDLRQAWDNLVEDRARMPQLGRYVTASSEVVLAYRAQFSIGQRTLLDVLNSESELYTAKSSLYSGLWAVTAGELRVLGSMGRLLETLGIAAMPPSPAGEGEVP